MAVEFARGIKDRFFKKGQEAPLFSPKNILVPVDGSEASLRGVEYACVLAKLFGAKLTFVHVLEIKSSLYLDEEYFDIENEGWKLLDSTLAIAKVHDVEAKDDLIQARHVERGIIDEAVDLKSDCIVLGVDMVEHLGEHKLGHVVSEVLAKSNCNVVLVRTPMDVEVRIRGPKAHKVARPNRS